MGAKEVKIGWQEGQQKGAWMTLGRSLGFLLPWPASRAQGAVANERVRLAGQSY